MSRERDRWLAATPDADPEVELARQRIGRLARLFERVLDEVAAEQGLSPGDLSALSALARGDGAQTPGELGATLGLTSGTVSTRLARLLDAGLIEQLESVGDARRRPVRLTRAGRRRWQRATAARVQRERDLMRGALDEGELQALNPLLATLLGDLETALGPAVRHDR